MENVEGNVGDPDGGWGRDKLRTVAVAELRSWCKRSEEGLGCNLQIAMRGWAMDRPDSRDLL